ncbi:MAG: hypothetical protein J2P17_01710 [Mycobacterium sp.]|nr:hypothetical protein [Mycobacterium sp.]
MVRPRWQAGDKTGAGDYGTRNDLAVLWPPNRVHTQREIEKYSLFLRSGDLVGPVATGRGTATPD